LGAAITFFDFVELFSNQGKGALHFFIVPNITQVYRHSCMTKSLEKVLCRLTNVLSDINLFCNSSKIMVHLFVVITDCILSPSFLGCRLCWANFFFVRLD